MEVAQLIVICENGYEEAHAAKPRNRFFKLLDITNPDEIKSTIWRNLQMLGRKGGVLVKYNGKMYLCEMQADQKNYTRISIDYHPYMKHFTI